LRQIEKFFIAGQAVADDERRMRSCARGLVDDAIDLQTVGWNVEHSHFCGMRGIGGRVGEDRRRNGLGGRHDGENGGEDRADEWAHVTGSP
jgi:hypothetical protein